mmetsp:Transcript_2922/g.6084  ORF Transcript_2922/g.6084 Transcript_2922/m.6084 type:complete len:286 (+) Transcript_2922:900-1757(+)
MPADAVRHVARHAEVRVLIDGAGDEALELLALAEHVREAVGEGRGRLHGGEGNLGDGVLIGEPEDAARLVEGDALRDGHHVAVEVAAHVVEVVEDERALGVETNCNDVLCILESQTPRLLNGDSLPDGLLVVSQLDHKGNFEGVLQVLGEHEWNQVAHVQGLGRGTPTSVEIETFRVLLIRVQQLLQVPVSEENPTTKERMGLGSGKLLHPCNEFWGDSLASELLHNLLVVNLAISSSRDVPRCDLLLCLGRDFQGSHLSCRHSGVRHRLVKFYPCALENLSEVC